MLSSPEPFELFALRYARLQGRKPADNYIGGGDFHNADSGLDYFVWVARRGAEVWLIDTGFGERAARERGRTLLLPVAKGLELLGLKAEQIENVIITHLHYDHAGTLDQFPNACFHLQNTEAAYATGPCMCHPAMRHPFDVEDIVQYVRTLYAGRVTFHNGSAELTPGLSVHWVGGHTAGLQVVRVFTQRGWVVLASDATHLYGNMERGIPFPIVYNVADMLQGHKTARALADSPDHVIPGHDPLVMEFYPPPTPELQGKVVRLDIAPTQRG